jgi:cobalamin biosynthesis Mg chelatase CobN
MLLKNLDVDAGLANGSRGVVVGLPRAPSHLNNNINNSRRDEELGNGSGGTTSSSTGKTAAGSVTAYASENGAAIAARLLEAAKAQVAREDESSGSGEMEKRGRIGGIGTAVAAAAAAAVAADSSISEASVAQEPALQLSSGDLSSSAATKNENTTATNSSIAATTTGSSSSSSSSTSTGSSNGDSSSTTSANAMEVTIEDSDDESEDMDYLMHGELGGGDIPREPAIEVQFLDGQRRFITRDALEMKDGNDKVIENQCENSFSVS